MDITGPCNLYQLINYLLRLSLFLSADDDDRIATLPVTCSTSSSSGSEDSDDETPSKNQRRLDLSSSPRNRDSVVDSPRRKEKEYDNLFLESLPEVRLQVKSIQQL